MLLTNVNPNKFNNKKRNVLIFSTLDFALVDILSICFIILSLHKYLDTHFFLNHLKQ